MARLLILFAHPALEKSRIHRQLIQRIPPHPDITFHDLYEAYPTFDINVPHEQSLLAAHDIILFQHPFYWYNVPALFKQWIDLVLEHGWAYGAEGTALRGKQWLHLISTGGAEMAYQPHGYNRFTIRQLLAPLEQTAYLCGLDFWPPYIIHGAHRLAEEDITAEASRYHQLLRWLPQANLQAADLASFTTLNQAFTQFAP